ncbi:MAG: hypothetical protein WCY89_05895 [Flavobacteriaceae bacterium]
MKPTVLLFFSILLFSCASKKETASKSNNCPSDGVCAAEILKNKSLHIINDKSTGAYHQFKENTATSVIIFKYDRNKDENLQDGHYQEEIIFEISNKMMEADFKDFTPEKKLFGVHCYCKGKAGYYPVENITVSYDKTTKGLSININEIVEGQVVKTITTTLTNSWLNK